MTRGHVTHVTRAIQAARFTPLRTTGPGAGPVGGRGGSLADVVTRAAVI